MTAHILFYTSRGEDASDFLPAPYCILMADCIYYEQVMHHFIQNHVTQLPSC